MKNVLTILAAVGAVGALSVFSAAGVQAAPMGPMSVGSGSDIVLVAEGCGRGSHRTPGGRCVRNLRPGMYPCWWTRNIHGRWRLVCR